MNVSINSLVLHSLLKSPVFTGMSKIKVGKSTFTHFSYPIVSQVFNFKISQSTFTHGLDHAIYINGKDPIVDRQVKSDKSKVQKCYFQKIVSSDDGGALFIWDDGDHSLLRVQYNYFEECYSEKNGGAIYSHFDYFLFQVNCYDNCIAKESGASVAIESTDVYFILRVNSSTFTQRDSDPDIDPKSTLDIYVPADAPFEEDQSVFRFYTNNHSHCHVKTPTHSVAIGINVAFDLYSSSFYNLNFYNNSGGYLFFNDNIQSIIVTDLTVANNRFNGSCIMSYHKVTIKKMRFFQNEVPSDLNQLFAVGFDGEYVFNKCDFDIPQFSDFTFSKCKFEKSNIKSREYIYMKSGKCVRIGPAIGYVALYIIIFVPVGTLVLSTALPLLIIFWDEFVDCLCCRCCRKPPPPTITESPIPIKNEFDDENEEREKIEREAILNNSIANNQTPEVIPSTQDTIPNDEKGPADDTNINYYPTNNPYLQTEMNYDGNTGNENLYAL